MNLQANNHFLRTTHLAADYVYIGDPGDEEELEVDELDHSDSSVEAPRKSAKVGPPTKRKRIGAHFRFCFFSFPQSLSRVQPSSPS